MLLKWDRAGAAVALRSSLLNTITVTRWGVLYLEVTEHWSRPFMLFDWLTKAASEKDEHPFASLFFFCPDLWFTRWWLSWCVCLFGVSLFSVKAWKKTNDFVSLSFWQNVSMITFLSKSTWQKSTFYISVQSSHTERLFCDNFFFYMHLGI